MYQRNQTRAKPAAYKVKDEEKTVIGRRVRRRTPRGNWRPSALNTLNRTLRLKDAQVCQLAPRGQHRDLIIRVTACTQPSMFVPNNDDGRFDLVDRRDRFHACQDAVGYRMLCWLGQCHRADLRGTW